MMKRKNILLRTMLILLVCLFTFTSCNGFITDNSSEDQTSHVHKFGSWKTVKKPTENREGVKERYCECGEVQSKAIDKLEDDDSDNVIDDNEGNEKTIAVIAKGETHAFWQSVKAGAEAAGEKYGYKIIFRGPSVQSEEYIGSQREMVHTALNNENVKAIVLATVGLGFGEALNQAYEKGIPVVEFDSGLYNNNADVTPGKDPVIGSVATDNKAAASFAAENFYAYLKSQGLAVNGYKVGIIQHDSTSAGVDRAAGFKEGMERLATADGIRLDIKVEVKTNGTGEYLLGLLALREWGAQSIFMTNEGVVNQLFPDISENAANYKDILFCGFEAGTNQYEWMVDEGRNFPRLVGSVAQDSFSIGYKAVELAAKKLAGEAVFDVGIVGVWYNVENIDILREQNIFYMG